LTEVQCCERTVPMKKVSRSKGWLVDVCGEHGVGGEQLLHSIE
jgi:hypothetical protein